MFLRPLQDLVSLFNFFAASAKLFEALKYCEKVSVKVLYIETSIRMQEHVSQLSNTGNTIEPERFLLRENKDRFGNYLAVTVMRFESLW